MTKCRPSRWVPWAVVGVGLPLLAAAWLNTGNLTADIADRAAKSLSADESLTWAKLESDGRDMKVLGTSPSQEAVDAAVKAVAGTYGVRTVTTTAQVVAPVAPVTLMAPTVESITSADTTPVIKGTWQEGVATSLKVTVNNQAYTLGQNPELTSSAGAWQLSLAQPLPPGSYDVSVESSDGKTTQGAAAPGKLVVETPAAEPPPAPPAPPAPTLAAAAVAGAAPQLSGTWAEEAGATLSAKLADQTYVLGKDAPLAADGPGKFILTPPASLAPGTYDVAVTSKSAAGAESTATAQLVIPEPAPAPAAQPVPEPVPAAPEPAPAAAPAALAAPTVDKAVDLTGAPILRGTWPEGNGNTLAVTVGTRTYALGKDANLQSKDGKWSLLPGAALKDGYYDIVATVTDPAGNAVHDASVAEIEVDGEQPATPTVVPPAADAAADAFTGTWDDKGATSLKVSVPQANVTAELGAPNSPLTADGGTWTLKLPAPLAAGTYDVTVQTTDSRGRTQQATAPTTIGQVAAAPAAPAAPAGDCKAKLADVGQHYPIRFEFKHTRINAPYDEAVAKYVEALKDPACATAKIEIAGHADYFGPRSYNELLSQLRAEAVMAQFVAAGVDAQRLSIKGYSELAPLVDEKSRDARSKNRRVELTVLN